MDRKSARKPETEVRHAAIGGAYEREGESMGKSLNNVVYPVVGAAILILGLIEFVMCSTMMIQTKLTYTSQTSLYFVIISNVKLVSAIFIGIGLLKRRSNAMLAALVMSVIFFGVLAVWLESSGQFLRENYPLFFAAYSYLVLPMTLLIPVALVVPDVKNIRLLPSRRRTVVSAKTSGTADMRVSRRPETRRDAPVKQPAGLSKSNTGG